MFENNNYKEYIVDSVTGEVIWVSYVIKNILIAYDFLSYDYEKNMYFFMTKDKDEIIKEIEEI
jgi:hypothetical protein